MKSITLHKLDSELSARLEERAKRRGQSLNRTAQDLLRTALGLREPRQVERTESFKDLFGTWSEEDVSDFDKRTSDLGRVDPTDWDR